ncbi:MAG: hypothetical protein KC416_02470 [Myxococcales bacterium]|nr:hypothetical protein [Myxococcales bacterium]
MPRSLGVVLALGFALVTSRVRAGNDDEILVGNEAALAAGAVGATSRDGSSLWYNPAGVALAKKGHIEGSGSAFVLRNYTIDGLIRTSSGQKSNADFLEIVSVPSALSILWPLEPGLVLGAGIFVTRAANSSISARLVEPLDSGREGEWLLVLTDRSAIYRLGLGLGWSILPRLRVGATAFATYEGITQTGQFSGGVIDPTTSQADSFVAGSSRLAADRVGLRAVLGIQFDPTDELSFGLTVMTHGLSIASRSESSSFAAEADSAERVFGADRRSDLSTGIAASEPLRLRASAAYRMGEDWISIDADYQTELTVPGLALQRDALVNARVGGLFKVDTHVWIGAGLFTDLSSERTPRSVGDSRADFLGGTFGIRYDHPLALAEPDADVLTFSTSIGLRYAYGFGEARGLITDGTSDPFVDVDYAVHEFALHIGSGLSY